MHDHHDAPGVGHNAQRPLQWQTPHLPSRTSEVPDPEVPQDLDLVEAAFVEGFQEASDPTSFLRLAGVPFATQRDGKTLRLVRISVEQVTDVAAVTPLIGGQGHNVAPLPKSHVGHRCQLNLHYLADDKMVALRLEEVRGLPDQTPQR